MNEEMYYRYKDEESEKDYLTRMLYIRNFDTPKNKKSTDNEIDVLRSSMETLRERAETEGVASSGTISTEGQ